MAKEVPQYEEVQDFRELAKKIADKYPHVVEANVEKVCCVKITNKERSESRKELHKTIAVKMPVHMHSPFGWYAVVYASDWDNMDRKHKLLLVMDILNDVPSEDEIGKLNRPDIKGYGKMFRTFKTVDYIDEIDVPDILNEDINWKTM